MTADPIHDAPEWATHVAIWGLPFPEWRWFDTAEAAHAFAMRIAGEGREAVEVREVGA